MTTPRPLRLARAIVRLGAWGLLSILVAFSLIIRVAPLMGRDLFVAVGGSMDPTIKPGTMLATIRIDPMTIGVGDVVTGLGDNAAVITHRVARIVDRPSGRFFELKGDANRVPDPTLYPSRAIIGRVAVAIPMVGAARAYLATPAGIITILSMVGALLLISTRLGAVERQVRSLGPGSSATSLDAVGP